MTVGGTITPTNETIAYLQADGTVKQEPRWKATSSHTRESEVFVTYRAASWWLGLIDSRVEGERYRKGVKA